MQSNPSAGRRRRRLAGSALVLALGVTAAATAEAAPRPRVTFPTPIPFSAPDLVNPNRGQERWGGISLWGDSARELFPNDQMANGYTADQKWPGTKTSYYRMNWRVLEPREGQYNWALLDQVLADAAARGERVGIRIMPMDSCCSPVDAGGVMRDYPEWLDAKMNAWMTKDKSMVPDWNDPDYLNGYIKLVKALGARYDRDDRFASLDIGGYGNWGEWHVMDFEKGPQGQVEMTNANIDKLFKAHLEAFPHTQLLALTPNDHLRKLVIKAPQVGLRVDTLGSAGFGGATQRLFLDRALLDRWQTQPFVVEWNTSNYGEKLPDSDPSARLVNQDVGRDMYQVGRKQVMYYHVSLLSSGNFPHAWNGQKMTPQQFRDFSMANKTAGYRYAVRRVQAPSQARAGSTIQVLQDWTNHGVAPTYDRWAPHIQLRDAKGQVVHEQLSTVELTKLFTARAKAVPQDGNVLPPVATQVVRDRIKLPKKLKSGRYTVTVEVVPLPKAGATTLMPGSFYSPMELAQKGRAADGYYTLATVNVR